MSEFTPRISKRTRKPSVKASTLHAGGTLRKSKHPVVVPSLEASTPVEYAPVDSTQPIPGLLSDNQRVLLSLREQVTKLKGSVPGPTVMAPPSVPVSLSASPEADVIPNLVSPQMVSPLMSSSSIQSISSPLAAVRDRPTSPMSSPAHSALPIPSDLLAGMLPEEDLLVARDSDTDSDGGEPSLARASRKLCKKTMFLSGSLGASLFSRMGPLASFSPSSNAQIDPHLKLCI